MNAYLFVCSVNMLRSPSAEHVARSMGYAADSAGTDPLSVRPLTKEAIDRAEHIVCMTRKHMLSVLDLAPDRAGDIWVWDVPDNYDYCQPELVEIFRNLLEQAK